MIEQMCSLLVHLVYVCRNPTTVCFCCPGDIPGSGSQG